VDRGLWYRALWTGGHGHPRRPQSAVWAKQNCGQTKLLANSPLWTTWTKQSVLSAKQSVYSVLSIVSVFYPQSSVLNTQESVYSVLNTQESVYSVLNTQESVYSALPTESTAPLHALTAHLKRLINVHRSLDPSLARPLSVCLSACFMAKRT
jgi:hypothetical protein